MELSKKDFIGRILLEADVIDRKDLEAALKKQQKYKAKMLGEIIVEEGFAAEDDVLTAYALQFGMRYVKLTDMEIPFIVADRLPVDFACRHVLVPVSESEELLTVAVHTHEASAAVEDLSMLLQKKIALVLSSRRQITDAVCRCYGISMREFEQRHAGSSVTAKIEDSTSLPDDRFVFFGEKMSAFMAEVRKAAEGDMPVLFSGEPGSGRSGLAAFLHEQSRRRERLFFKVDCSALPDTLLESELFGHEKGAFAGAYARRPGRFELAEGGTVFLEEISGLSLQTQSRLMRFLEDGEVERLGGFRPIRTSARLLASTCRNLEEEVRLGKFREDLWRKLSLTSFTVPPLRERQDEIEILAEHFINRAARRAGRKPVEIAPRTLKLLAAYPWPGNTAELEDCLERAFTMSEDGKIQPQHLPVQYRTGAVPVTASGSAPSATHDLIKPGELVTMEEMERRYMRYVLESVHWNQTKASEILDLHRNTLSRLIKEFKLG